MNIHSGGCTYRCLDFCYPKVNESVCTYEYMAGLIIELIGTCILYSPVGNYTLDTIEVIMTTVTIMIV